MSSSHSIATLLQQLLNSLQMLRTLLSDERDILVLGDYDQMQIITTTKQNLLDKIEIENKNFREKTLQYTGLDTNRSILKYFTQHYQSLLKDWEAVEDLLTICKQQNTINGIIVSNTQRTIRNSLSILHGKSTDVLTYAASGQSVSINFSSATVIV